MRNKPHLGFIGFGEAGQAFARGFGAAGLESLTAFDLRGDDPEMQAAAKTLGVRLVTSAGEVIKAADIVFAAVPPSEGLDVARSLADGLEPGQIYVDVNSASPEHKRQAAAVLGVDSFVDLAVIGPVGSNLQATPCLASGPAARRLIEALTPFGMHVDFVGEEVGTAALIRMTRSIVVKGLEALVYECLATARAAGVERAVLDTLTLSWPGIDWDALATHHLERMLQHGVRRAAEMREVASTVEEFGLDAHMARATIEHQERLGNLPLTLPAGDLGDMLDRIRMAAGLHPVRTPDARLNGYML